VDAHSTRARRALVFLAFAVFLAARADAQETNQTEPLLGLSSPRFGADIHAYLTSGGAKLGFDLECPYSELQFIRIASGFGAAVRVTVVFRGAKNRQAGGDVWDELVAVPTFEATRVAASRLRFHRDFALPAGSYKVEVKLEDLNGGRVSKAEGNVKVPSFEVGAIGLGDLQFGFCRDDSLFVRLPSRRYEADLDALCVLGSIYDRRAGDEPRSYRLEYAMHAESGEVVQRGDTTLSRAGDFLLRPPARDLFLGTYTLEIEVKEGERRWKSERSFEVETLTMPRGQSYASVVEILSYIATDQEYEDLRKAKTDDDRTKQWDLFWQRRDPSPDTPRNEALLDFFKRVRFANTHFSGQTVAGWRTDQGRIYIRYGAPDQVEERAATFYDPPLVIWHYYGLNRRFVFADREGFGRYELVSPGGER
jgi:GWxTD domain-containing protein